MKKILKGLDDAKKKTARESVNSAFFFAAFQPKELDSLKKKNK